jgi:hypothetical protein
MTAMTDARMNTNMHSAFKREILRLRDGLRKADLGDTKATEGLARRYKFFSVTLHQHHQGEDTFLYPNIRPKANPLEIVVLDAMEAEHGALACLLGSLEPREHLWTTVDEGVVLGPVATGERGPYGGVPAEQPGPSTARQEGRAIWSRAAQLRENFRLSMLLPFGLD